MSVKSVKVFRKLGPESQGDAVQKATLPAVMSFEILLRFFVRLILWISRSSRRSSDSV